MNESDFVIHKTIGPDNVPHFVGGGYKINLQASTLNTLNNIFDNLAVPSGLFYEHKKYPKEQCVSCYEQHDTLSDDIFDKLFSLVEYDKKNKRKTHKHNKVYKNKKTRKH
jgi:hypothetical protein